MSKDLIKSATIKANEAELNYIDFKGDDIGISMRPELVHRTELHPVISNEGELESRVYYTLHNDAGGAVYLSPSMHAENVNNITQVVVPGPYEPAIPTLPDTPPHHPVLPPLPPSIEIPFEPGNIIDPDGPLPPDNPYWPGPNIDLPPYPPIDPLPPIDGGGGGGGTGGAPSGPAPQGGNFDDYAEKLVNKIEPFATNKTFRRVENVLKWHHKNKGMVSAVRAMKGTRGYYINPFGVERRSNEGKIIDEEYRNLVNGSEMYTESNITKAKISAPNMELAPAMFKLSRVAELNLVNLAKLEDATSFVENVYKLKALDLSSAKKLELADYLCHDSTLRSVKLDTTCLRKINSAFEKSNLSYLYTINNEKHFKVNQLYFPKVSHANRAFKDLRSYDAKICHFPELLEGESMFESSGISSTKIFDFPKLINMKCMFKDCVELTFDNGKYGTKPDYSLTPDWVLNAEDAYVDSSLRVAAGSYGPVHARRLFANIYNLEYIIPPPNGLAKAYTVEKLSEGSTSLIAFFSLDSNKVDKTFDYNKIPTFDNLKCVNLDDCVNAENMFSRNPNLETVAIKFGQENVKGILSREEPGIFNSKNLTSLKQVKFIANKIKSVEHLLEGSANLTRVYVEAEKAKDATGLFKNCIKLTGKKLKYKLDNVIKIDSMLEGCASIKGTYDFGVLPKLCYAKDVMKNSGITHAKGTFGSRDYGFNSIGDVFKNSNVIVSNINFPGAGNARAAFYNNLKIQGVGGDYSKVTTADFMFKGCTSLTNVSVDMYNLVTARYMFRDCSALKKVSLIDTNLRGYAMPSLKDAFNMFAFSSIEKVLPYRFPSLQIAERMYNGASQLSGTVSFTINKENEPADAPASGQYPKVWNTLYMFRATNIDTIADLNLTNVSNGIGMFAECYNLQHVTGEVTFRDRGDYQNMFDCARFDEASAEKIIRAASAANVYRMHVGLGFTPPRNEDGSVTLGGMTFSHKVSNREMQWQGDGRWLSLRFNG